MKQRVIKRNIKALFTNNHEATAKAINESEAILIPDKILRQAADIALSISANLPQCQDDIKYLPIISTYIMRYAYLLNRQGELLEEQPKPHKPQQTDIIE